VISEDLQSFEAALRRRSDRADEAMAEVLSIDVKEVRHAAASVTRILQRLAGAIVDATDDPSSVNDFLRELDLKLISRDHDWRGIFAEIAGKGEDYEPHKRVLIVKYLQYLSTRKRLLAHVLAHRTALEDTDEQANHAQEADMGRRSGKPEGALDAASLRVQAPEYFERLQMGESVQLDLPRGRTIDLLLARHVYRLSGSDESQLIAPDGTAHPLNEGRTMIGRHPECDIVTDRNFHDISRVHVIIEWNREPRVKVTDLSTLGTFVPGNAISE
jgi:hypothetical protein